MNSKEAQTPEITTEQRDYLTHQKHIRQAKKFLQDKDYAIRVITDSIIIGRKFNDIEDEYATCEILELICNISTGTVRPGSDGKPVGPPIHCFRDDVNAQG